MIITFVKPSEQSEHLREMRKRQLEQVVDKIVEGRRKKLQGLATKKKKGKVKKEDSEEPVVRDEDIPEIDRDKVLQEELDKMPALSIENTIVQTFTGEFLLLSKFAKILENSNFNVSLSFSLAERGGCLPS